jgi:DNA topoisomerase-2
MADQGEDGSHFKALIVNFKHSMWPSLFRIQGFLSEFMTPTVKAFDGQELRTFYSLPEFIEWKKQHHNAIGWSVVLGCRLKLVNGF